MSASATQGGHNNRQRITETTKLDIFTGFRIYYSAETFFTIFRLQKNRMTLYISLIYNNSKQHLVMSLRFCIVTLQSRNTLLSIWSPSCIFNKWGLEVRPTDAARHSTRLVFPLPTGPSNNTADPAFTASARRRRLQQVDATGISVSDSFYASQQNNYIKMHAKQTNDFIYNTVLSMTTNTTSIHSAY